MNEGDASCSNNSPALPHEVIQAIENGNEAIKLLREKTRLGLKESKDLVATYKDNRPASSQPVRRGDSNNGLLILVIALGIVVYVIYKLIRNI